MTTTSRPLRLALAACALGCLLGAAPTVASAQEGKPVPVRDRRDAPKPDTAAARPAVPLPSAERPVPPVRQGERSDTTTEGEAKQPPQLPPDSTLDALKALEGFTATVYQGARATYAADSERVALQGVAELEREGQKITADSLLTFSQQSSVVCGYGSPVLSGEGKPLESEQVCYDVERRVGMAVGARTEFTENATWYVHGDRVFTSGNERLYSAGTDFTTCDLEIPHYHFHASRFKIVNDQILVARDVTLNFGDVPVFWLPFLVQSLKQGRRSGLLTPDFSITDVVQTGRGRTRQINNLGAYWAINDYMGAEAAFGWRSGDWVSLRGEFQYRWLRQFLEGDVNVQQYWQEGGRNLTLRTNNTWQPDERTRVSAAGTYATSNRFIADNSYSPIELSRTLRADASVSHRFDWGNASLGASRTQAVIEDHTNLVAPSLSVSLNPITLASPRVGGDPLDLIWSGSGSFRSSYDDVDERRSGPLVRDEREHTADVGSSLSFGRLSWSQAANLSDDRVDAKPQIVTLRDSVTVAGDTITVADTTAVLPVETVRDVSWNSSLRYRQSLVGTSTFEPTVSVRGQLRQSPATSNELISAPVTFGVGATLRGDLFGFWPGVGPFERFRHRLSPSITYQYQPAPSASALQDSVFGTNVRERNTITIGLNQTIEAKRPLQARREAAADTGAAPFDSTAAPSDTTEAVSGAGQAGLTGGRSEEPRKLETQRPLVLLSLQTSAVALDFAEEKRGGHLLTTTQMTNSLRSDLLQGLQVSFTHDLFESTGTGTTTGTGSGGVPVSGRKFSPRLRSMSASFGFGGDAWLFRVLGFGNGEEAEETPDSLNAASRGSDPASLVPGGSGSRRGLGGGRVGNVGTWHSDFTYSLTKPPAGSTTAENQQLNMSLALQPTENWSLHWTTGYSITDSEFASNALTLTRSLHRWQADFQLLKAQNGNFTFRFEARLSDLPDLKVPYDQRDNAARNR